MSQTPRLHLEIELADYLCAPNRIVWRGIGIGSRWLQGGNIPVPDVLVLRMSYNLDLAAYECKASRSDFHADVNVGKYRRYFPICNRLFFAAPSGLLRKDDIPDHCGLLTFNADKKSWAVIKSARRREIELSQIDWLSLLFARAVDSHTARRLAERNVWEENLPLREKARRLGDALAVHIDKLEHRDHRETELIMEAAREFVGADGSLAAWQVSRLLRSLGAMRRRHDALQAAFTVMEAVIRRQDDSDVDAALAAMGTAAGEAVIHDEA